MLSKKILVLVFSFMYLVLVDAMDRSHNNQKIRKKNREKKTITN